ncbi:Murein DD-endopeptidase MepM and murein hydrolase activator NlpD, contain LysM domain [Friedmanniella luteola]|uniref:Murein DD-endopeptidase MepM and murein hydrolase activator NlpD, contain LysM domain n=1 Tax=Friedmanniella luteola TaxID=546871 RepID=A0A1H1YRY8_9ACTN|nr:peptidoglycan DD-metalloendopeptidase family protein [Friedmanniella luteola]SDT24218.1 Murein DD-endopeptidase MepM and murein hydrolase activator NlpD, contain LysM domain [Friedmanniella luteola]
MLVPTPRRPARRADVVDVERRSWLSTATAALAVSALGLVLAGSITATGNAEPRPAPPGVASPQQQAVRVATPSPTPDPSVLEAFSFGGDGGEPLRQAIVAEHAAQRAEELAKDAEAISRAANQARTKARQEGLTAAEKATQAKGAELARQALERAAAARAAAVTARAAAEAAAKALAAAPTTAPTTAPTGPTAPAAPTVPDAPVVVTGGGGAVSPVPGAVVGASFGQYGLWSRYHTGLDFRAGYGVPIKAVKSGTVLYAGNSGDWAGNHVAVLHGDGMTTMSSHMSSMAVSAGQTVQAGQVLGYVGQTGRAFGPHLHFELYPAGVRYGDVYRAVDPVPWLRAAGVATR